MTSLAVRPHAPQFKLAPLANETMTHNGAFAGYASLFETPDLSNDIIAPGAFAQCLARRAPRDIKLLFQHDASQPIGVWTTLREDVRGLYVEGQLALDNSNAANIQALLRSGAIDGLSIGFKTITASRNARTGQRRLTKLDLWEISIVTFPMLPQAKITALKNLSPPPQTSRMISSRSRSPATLSNLAAAIRSAI